MFELYRQENFRNISFHWHCSIVYSWKLILFFKCSWANQVWTNFCIEHWLSQTSNIDSTVFYYSFINNLLLKHGCTEKFQTLRSIVPYSCVLKNQEAFFKIQKFFEQEFIEPVTYSPKWVCSLVCVLKKNGDARFCIKRHKANTDIIRNYYPTPTWNSIRSRWC